MPEKPTFEECLRESFQLGSTTEFRLKLLITDDAVTFYIHPDSQDGDTQDYKVEGNQLTCISQFLDPAAE